MAIARTCPQRPPCQLSAQFKALVNASVTSGLKALNYLSRDTPTATDFNAIGLAHF
jgi:hypothetical protein